MAYQVDQQDRLVRRVLRSHQLDAIDSCANRLGEVANEDRPTDLDLVALFQGPNLKTGKVTTEIDVDRSETSSIA